MKYCYLCKLLKLQKNFYKNKSKKDGLSSECKECFNAKSKEYRNKNINKIKKQRKIRYEKNKENILAKQKEKRILRTHKQIEHYSKYFKDYRKSNIGVLTKYNKNRYNSLWGRFKYYSVKKNFSLTFEEFSLYWKNPCYYCHSCINTIGLDRYDNHKGYAIGNVVPCCKICNYAKGKCDISEFVSYLVQIANYHYYGTKRVVTRQTKRKLSLRTQYSNYKRNAKKKDKFFRLLFEDFIKFNKCCSYCGTFESGFIGIDRKNNCMGYDIDNCTSCCKICNTAKSDLDIESWTIWLNNISDIYVLRGYIDKKKE